MDHVAATGHGVSAASAEYQAFHRRRGSERGPDHCEAWQTPAHASHDPYTLNPHLSRIARLASISRTCSWIYQSYWLALLAPKRDIRADSQYRLVALPGLLSAPCHYCGLRMKVPDGLPLANTGYIPKEVRDKAEKATTDGETQTDETEPKPDRGQWVAWHLSCEPV